jgi:hypothetical protein
MTGAKAWRVDDGDEISVIEGAKEEEINIYVVELPKEIDAVCLKSNEISNFCSSVILYHPL